jgi:hypothetical protein
VGGGVGVSAIWDPSLAFGITVSSDMTAVVGVGEGSVGDGVVVGVSAGRGIWRSWAIDPPV